jgi:hypothetical protein
MSADVRLVSRDQPVHMTQLLRSEHHHILCPEVCAVHLVNELLTPEVAYGTWKDFVDLVYKVQEGGSDLGAGRRRRQDHLVFLGRRV